MKKKPKIHVIRVDGNLPTSGPVSSPSRIGYAGLGDLNSLPLPFVVIAGMVTVG